MTTIIANRERMCSDSKVTIGSEKFSTVKIFAVRGALIGTAGNFGPGERFMEWWGTGRVIPKVRREKKEEFEALVLTRTGLFYYGDDWAAIPVQEGVLAIGSGGKPAMAAIRKYGDTLEGAIEAACTADDSSALPVQTFWLRDVPPKRQRKG